VFLRARRKLPKTIFFINLFCSMNTGDWQCIKIRKCPHQIRGDKVDAQSAQQVAKILATIAPGKGRVRGAKK
jgi:hypothetical protein